MMRCFLEISRLYMRRSITHLQVCIRNGIPRMDCDIAHNVGQGLIPEQNHQPTRNYKKFMSPMISTFFSAKPMVFLGFWVGFPSPKKKNQRTAGRRWPAQRRDVRREEARQGVGEEPPGATFPQRAMRAGWERRLDDSSHQRVGFTCNECEATQKRMLA